MAAASWRARPPKAYDEFCGTSHRWCAPGCELASWCACIHLLYEFNWLSLRLTKLPKEWASRSVEVGRREGSFHTFNCCRLPLMMALKRFLRNCWKSTYYMRKNEFILNCIKWIRRRLLACIQSWEENLWYASASGDTLLISANTQPITLQLSFAHFPKAKKVQ